MGMSNIARKIRRMSRHASNLGLKGAYGVIKAVSYGALRNKARPMPKLDHQEVLLISLPLAATDQPPLGIASLKAYLKHKGVSSACIDFNIELYGLIKRNKSFRFENLHDILLDSSKLKEFKEETYDRIMDSWISRIMELNPRFLGISVTSALTYPSISYMVGKLRQKNPDLIIILGGPRCRHDGHDFIEKQYGDIVVKGEGEESFFRVLSSMTKSQPMEGIPGIIFRNNDAIIETGNEEYITSLDALPFPDFDDFPLGEYESKFGIFPKLPISGSRGCVANCRFCSIHFYWGKYRARSPKNIFEEMLYHKKKYGVCSFSFNDSLINASPKVLEELCDLIISSGEAFFWGSTYRIWNQAPRGLFEKMVKAGCNTLAIGVESGSETVRKDMSKPITDKALGEQIKAMHGAGLDTRLLFIVGYPTETEEDFKKTIEFVKDNRRSISSVSFGITCQIPKGTLLWESREKFGIRYDADGNWYMGDNTVEERMRRLEYANIIGNKLGLVSYKPVLNVNKLAKFGDF